MVRAAAASEIPLISAVGHETDTTLIDFASDRRAPTPTAAAEIAVPVRGELLELVGTFANRLLQAGRRGLAQRVDALEGLGRGLIHPGRLLEEKAQRLDDLAERRDLAARNLLERRRGQVTELGGRLVHPRQLLKETETRLTDLGARLRGLGPRVPREAERSLERLDPARRLSRALGQHLRDSEQELTSLDRLLESFSYTRTLERGFAVVRVQGEAGERIATRADQVHPGDALELEFAGRERVAAIAGQGAKPKSKTKPKAGASQKPSGGGPEQGSLL